MSGGEGGVPKDDHAAGISGIGSPNADDDLFVAQFAEGILEGQQRTGDFSFGGCVGGDFRGIATGSLTRGAIGVFRVLLFRGNISAIEVGEVGFIEESMNGAITGVDAALVLFVGGGADADDETVRGEEPASGAALFGDAGAFDVVGSAIAIDACDGKLLFGGDFSSGATDAEDAVPGAEFEIGLGDGGNREGSIGGDGDQSDIGLEVAFDEFSDEGDGSILEVGEEVDFDDGSFGVEIAEDMTAGDDVSLSDFAADDGSGAEVGTVLAIGDADAGAGGHGSGSIEFGEFELIDFGAGLDFGIGGFGRGFFHEGDGETILRLGFLADLELLAVLLLGSGMSRELRGGRAILFGSGGGWLIGGCLCGLFEGDASDEGAEGGFGLVSGESLDFLAVDDEDETGDSADLELIGELSLLIDVDFFDGESLAFHLFDDGRDLSAGTAPGGGEIEEDAVVFGALLLSGEGSD